MLAGLKDPDSAKFGATFARKTVGEGSATIYYRMVFVPVDPRTDLVCGTVNSKNSGRFIGGRVTGGGARKTWTWLSVTR